MSKRIALIEAAKALLWERGYEAMSPRAVQERSESGQGSFYHHFKGKLDLASEALWQVATEMAQASAMQMRDGASPLRRMTAFLKMPRQALRGCRLGRLAHEEAIAQDPVRQPVEAYFTAVERILEAAVAEAKQRGELDAELEPEAVAAALVAVVQGGHVLARVHQDEGRLERAVSGLLQLLESGARRRPGLIT